MPLDRASRQLTGYVPPRTARPMPPNVEKDSIFGNTYNGVPNPMIPYEHPYPTRYHGPVFVYPMPAYKYEVSPYARSPFNGDDGGILGSRVIQGVLLVAGVGLLVGIAAFLAKK